MVKISTRWKLAPDLNALRGSKLGKISNTLFAEQSRTKASIAITRVAASNFRNKDQVLLAQRMDGDPHHNVNDTLINNIGFRVYRVHMVQRNSRFDSEISRKADK